MSKRKNKNNKKYVVIAAVIILFILICVGAGVSSVDEAAEVFANTISSIGDSISQTWTGANGEQTKKEAKVINGTLEMHTIDVGQGDSTLFIQGEKTMLIDCGTKSKGKDVVKYLQNLGISKIDVLIGTHPHDDHMGGMAEVINSFEIGELYTPDNSKDDITTTWYIEFLNAVDKNNVKWKYPKSRRNFSDRGCRCTNFSTKF